MSSEIGQLKRVIVHRPDDGIERISPKRAEELLFDDIVYLPQMQEEHDIFTSVLKAFLGEDNVLETQQLTIVRNRYAIAIWRKRIFCGRAFAARCKNLRNTCNFVPKA